MEPRRKLRVQQKVQKTFDAALAHRTMRAMRTRKPATQGRPILPRGDFDGAKLRKLRQARELAAHDLSILVGCGEQSIYNWERSFARPSEAMVAKFESVFGVKRGAFKL